MEGAATFYYPDGRKDDVHVRRRYDTDQSGSPARWCGAYVAAPRATVSPDAFYARFSDGCEADIVIEPRDERCGRFVVTSDLADSTARPRPDI
jgi:hypothetical protein